MLVLIPPDLEPQLLEAAKRSGVEPEEFAVARVREALQAPSVAPRTLFDALEGFIGAVDGTDEAWSEEISQRFADGMVEKHRSGNL